MLWSMKRQRSVHCISCPVDSQGKTGLFYSEIFADLQGTDTTERHQAVLSAFLGPLWFAAASNNVLLYSFASVCIVPHETVSVDYFL